MGVLFFIINVVFACVILIMCLYSSIRALMSKNPETRYQPMRDDRGSFIKSSTNLAQTTELDALGATARGVGDANEPPSYYERKHLEEDEDSVNSSAHYSGANTAYQGGYNKEASQFLNTQRSESPFGQPRPSANLPSRTASPANNMWQRGVGY
jgi:Transient receptor potential (TRP) ion channel